MIGGEFNFNELRWMFGQSAAIWIVVALQKFEYGDIFAPFGCLITGTLPSIRTLRAVTPEPEPSQSIHNFQNNGMKADFIETFLKNWFM